MRRPALIVFIIFIFISFIYTNCKGKDLTSNNKEVVVSGINKEVKQKKKYDEYIVNKFLVKDFIRKSKMPVGYEVEIKGKYESLDGFELDFDYGKYLKSKGIRGVITLKQYKIIKKRSLYYYANKIKENTIKNIEYLYKDNSKLLNSLILGDKDNLSDDDLDLFSKTGISHVIALSGLHIGIISAIIVFIIGGINRLHKFIIFLFIVLVYIFMVGPSPSIIRAFFFCISIYMAFFIQQRYDSISSISIIGIILISQNPYIIYNTGFQLSFLATLSIVYFYDIIYRFVKIKLMSVTIAANILTLPILYYTFKMISLISVISNMLILPFISIIIILTLISIISINFGIMITQAIVAFNNIIINYIFFTLNKLYELRYSYIEIKEPKFSFVVIYYVIVFYYMIYRELKIIKEQENGLQGYSKADEAR